MNKRSITMVILTLVLQASLTVSFIGGSANKVDVSPYGFTLTNDKVYPEIDMRGGLWYDDFSDLDEVNITGGFVRTDKGLTLDLTFDDFENYANNTDLIGENGWIFHNSYGLGSFISDNRTGFNNSSANFARSMNTDKVKNQIILSKAFDISNGSLRAYLKSNYIYPDEKVSSRFHLLGTRSTSPTYTTDVIMALGFNNGGIAVLSTGNWYQLTRNVLPNIWYQIDLDWTSYDHVFDIKITSMNGTVLASMEDLNFRNELGSAMRFSMTTGFRTITQTHMETCIDDVMLRDRDLVRTNTIVSRPIILPSGNRWTTLRIDHENALGAYTEFELLTSEGRSLMNLFVGSDQCETELGYLNNEGIVEVRCSYSCSVTSFETPILRGWGLEWEAENTWKDSFLTQKRTNGNTTASFIKGSYTLNSTNTEGIVNSRMVVRPDKTYWRTFDYDGYSDVGGSIGVDILDGLTGTPLSPFTDLQPGSYDISSIDYEEHQYLNLRAKLSSNGSMPILRSWSLRWGENNGPEVTSVTGPKSVLRSYPCTISVSARDPERDPSSLIVGLSYLRPGMNGSLSSELTGPIFNETKRTWDFTFTPLENAPLGLYSFISQCMDEVGYESPPVLFNDSIEVKNNPPQPPNFELIPRNPTTIDDLRTVVSVKATDREGETLTYTYRWLLNGKELKAYSINDGTHFSPSLPSNVHKKGDVIRLEVKVNDSRDWSEVRSAQTVISNSPIKVVQNYPQSISLLEDTTDDDQLDLSKFFYDEDGDQLTFRSNSLVHSKVSVSTNGTVSIEPDTDWYGMERMVFNATDGSTSASLGIDLIIQSVNDEPIARLLAPSSGTVHVRVGEGVVFIAEGSDKDKDDLTFTWKDGQVHLGAGERITLNWTTPGMRTIECHVSDGYMDLVHARVLVNVTKRPVMPGGETNETGTGGLGKMNDNKLAFYILPVIAFFLLVILVILAFVAARYKARRAVSEPSPEPIPERVYYGHESDYGHSGDLEVLGLEPVPIEEGLPEYDEGGSIPAEVREDNYESPILADGEGDARVDQQTPPGDGEGSLDVPSIENIDLQAELDSIESTLNEMLGPKGGQAPSDKEDPLIPTL